MDSSITCTLPESNCATCEFVSCKQLKQYSIISFWKDYNIDNNFFTDIVFNKNKYKYINFYDNDNNNNNIDILLCGSFINIDEYNKIKNLNCYKILYISEPIEKNNIYIYTLDLINNNGFNLIFGCINNNNFENKFKYPLYYFYFNYKNDIFNIVNNYVKNCNLNKEFCCLINNHDSWNTRTPIYNKLSLINKITCPSKLLNNCSNYELNNIGNIEYIKKFLFNICSENCITNIKGYITEKLLNCCLGGAIPVYCGWFDDIDNKIFNKNRIFFYDYDDKNSLNNIFIKINELIEDKNKLKEFYSQDVFVESAYETLNILENNLINKFNDL